MTKAPVPGRVKSRLTEGGILDESQSAAIAAAMLRCVLARLAPRGPVVLAVSPDGSAETVIQHLGKCPPGLRIVDQGHGDLGRRMDRSWLAAAPQGPVAFFGIDSPDVPETHLEQLAAAIRRAGAALGPTVDGGIWTLAGTRRLAPILSGIDWGTERVYDQLRGASRQHDANVAALPQWHDVDRPEDVTALRRRLDAVRPATPGDPSWKALQALRDELNRICLTADA